MLICVFPIGLVEGTPEYEARLAQAKAKFNERYGAKSVPTPSPAPSPTPLATPTPAEASPEDQKRSVELKNQGNSCLQAGKLEEAIELYTQAITLHPTAVYFSNRAAAKISLGRFTDALPDCERAVELKSTYAKAHYRLGQCHLATSLDKARRSFNTAAELSDAHTKADIKSKLARIEKALGISAETDSKQATNTSVTPSAPKPANAPGAGGMPDLSGLLGALGGGGAGGGGMPDLSALMNNPMMQQMAQSLGGGAGAGGGAGGMPDLSAMMNNPAIQQMAQQMMPGLMANMGGEAPQADTGSAETANSSEASVSGEGSEESLPDLSALMNDPSLAGMANDPNMANLFNPEMMANMASMFGGQGQTDQEGQSQ